MTCSPGRKFRAIEFAPRGPHVPGRQQPQHRTPDARNHQSPCCKPPLSNSCPPDESPLRRHLRASVTSSSPARTHHTPLGHASAALPRSVPEISARTHAGSPCFTHWISAPAGSSPAPSPRHHRRQYRQHQHHARRTRQSLAVSAPPAQVHRRRTGQPDRPVNAVSACSRSRDRPRTEPRKVYDPHIPTPTPAAMSPTRTSISSKNSSTPWKPAAPTKPMSRSSTSRKPCPPKP